MFDFGVLLLFIAFLVVSVCLAIKHSRISKSLREENRHLKHINALIDDLSGEVSSERLSQHWDHPEYLVRAVVAQSQYTPIEDVVMLVCDDSATVRLNAARNARLPIRESAALLKDEDWEVRLAALLNPHLPWLNSVIQAGQRS